MGTGVDAPSVQFSPDGLTAEFLSSFDPLVSHTGTLQYAQLSNDSVTTLGAPVGYNVDSRNQAYLLSPSGGRVVYMQSPAVVPTQPTVGTMFEAKLDGISAPLILLHHMRDAAWLNDTVVYGERDLSPIPYHIQDGFYFNLLP